MRDREPGAGSWSFFGDPRAISHDEHTFTGWISTTGNVWVARYTKGGKLSKRLIFRGLGRDDHNNPSLVVRRDGHLMVFFAPHSGRSLPPPGIKSVMRYMVSREPYSIREFGKVHTVPTNVPGGLGYTYPNPVPLVDKLWLFWRGGGWNPTFSYTEDGVTWVRARELVRFGHGQRPYAKYVGGGGRRIHAIFSDGHVSSWQNSRHYLRYEAGDLYAADGRHLGSLKSVPLHTSKLDHVYRYSARGGRAWPQDIALTADDGRASSTSGASGRTTPTTTLITTAGSGSAARSPRRTATRPGRRSTTTTRASSTYRAGSDAGGRSSSGSPATRAARGGRAG
jgi:hypothetical protein